MIDVPIEIFRQVDKNTTIVNGYFDMDAKEFVSKDELLKRFNKPSDYCTKSHALDKVANEHQILRAYSKKHFMVWDAEYEARKVSGVTLQ